ncbi:glycoside hydrolase family 43 protein [Lacticaseibacillus parakribbianus]|uniref:glycoside hydrolase family 43 protein n=1 Tax=Lacticaseibacillus parakribbianus TaxID=2970927 RepID=UPI0021CB4C95|nr:glycoside hydrolase family 43 protein [Lacticaseibacillus parakribbianus]
MNYHNPILPGFNPDPSICFDGTAYTLVTSSFEFYPGLPLYQSTDLLNWRPVGAVITAPTTVTLTGIANSQGLFAPTIRYHAGRYFVVCTNITQGTFITSAAAVTGPWTAPVFVDCPSGIDPSLTFVGDRCYMYLTVALQDREAAEIDLFEIDPRSGRRLSPVTPISNGYGGRDVEAPHIFQKGGDFYLMLAEGGTREGHMVTMARANAITGPYQPCPFNPVLSNRNSRSELQNVGHADLVQAPNGAWWLVALAARARHHRTLLGRETILLPVNWDGPWPIVNGGGQATATVATTALTAPQQAEGGSRFVPAAIRTLGMPTPYTISGDRVDLANQPAPIAVPVTAPVAFISVSQTAYAFTFTAQLAVAQLVAGRFGLLLYKDNGSQASLTVSGHPGAWRLSVARQAVDLQVTQTVALPDSAQVTLELRGTTDAYQLRASTTQGPAVQASFDARHLTPEVADSRFTGVQVGLFARAAGGHTVFTHVAYQNR